MATVTYIGDAEDVAIPGGPLWAVGQARELDDAEAARYRTSNVFTVGDAPSEQAADAPPEEGQ